MRSVLPPNAVLVGQNVGQDVSWLGLKEGTDFGGLQDLQVGGRCVCAPLMHGGCGVGPTRPGLSERVFLGGQGPLG